jgi:hypothetical protein
MNCENCCLKSLYYFIESKIVCKQWLEFVWFHPCNTDLVWVSCWMISLLSRVLWSHFLPTITCVITHLWTVYFALTHFLQDFPLIIAFCKYLRAFWVFIRVWLLSLRTLGLSFWSNCILECFWADSRINWFYLLLEADLSYFYYLPSLLHMNFMA